MIKQQTDSNHQKKKKKKKPTTKNRSRSQQTSKTQELGTHIYERLKQSKTDSDQFNTSMPLLW